MNIFLALAITLMPLVPSLKPAGANQYYVYNPTSVDRSFFIFCRGWQSFRVKVQANSRRIVDIDTPLLDTTCVLINSAPVKE